MITFIAANKESVNSLNKNDRGRYRPERDYHGIISSEHGRVISVMTEMLEGLEKE